MTIPNSLESVFFGSGITRPFRRDKKTDFASESGLDLIRSQVGQVLGTRASSNFSQGELPWNPQFGSLLHLLKHRNTFDGTKELAHVYVIEALKKYVPRIRVKEVDISISSATAGAFNQLNIFVVYDVLDSQQSDNVVVEDVAQQVQI